MPYPILDFIIGVRVVVFCSSRLIRRKLSGRLGYGQYFDLATRDDTYQSTGDIKRGKESGRSAVIDCNMRRRQIAGAITSLRGRLILFNSSIAPL